MSFANAIKVCFAKYADFNGRAKRPEFWWFTLFVFLTILAMGMVSDILYALFSLAVLLPSLAAGTRRLHDTNRSGWWQLLWILPFIGGIIMIIFMAQEGDMADNQFGSLPIN